jgi:NADH-quinone oxidoreductase subunit A
MSIALKYAPVLLLFFLAVLIPVLLLFIAAFTGPRQASERKMKLFECGVDPVGEPRHRYSVKFFLVALLFVIFDIEAVFVYPWAVMFREMGIFGFVEMSLFLFILILGLVYVWKKGALEWE